MPKGRQFSEEERIRLRRLVLAKKDIVECKRNDFLTLKSKKETWENITETFNATFKYARTSEQLRRLWENIKFKRKAELIAKKKEELLQTKKIFPPPSNDHVLDSLSLETMEIKEEAADNNFVLSMNEDSNEYVIEHDMLINRKPAGSQDMSIHIIEHNNSTESDEEITICHEAPPEISKNEKFSLFKLKKKKCRADEEEETTRLLFDNRGKHSLDFDQKLLDLRTEEAEMNKQIAKNKLKLLKMKEEFKKEKYKMQLNILKRCKL